MSTKLYNGDEGRSKLLDGMKQVFDAVKVTYGGNGRNVVYNKWSGVPVASNDGENIADQIQPEDLTELQGANLIRQVARNTNSELEDGSTATIIDSYIMSRKGNDLLISNNRISPIRLRKQMREAARNVIEEIKSSVILIETVDDLENLARTSVEDEGYGKIIANTIYEAGNNGIIYVNESDKIGMSVEQDEGYQFKQGLVSPYLIKNVDRLETKLEDVAVLVNEMQITFPNNEFLSLIDGIVKNGNKNILLICDDIHPKLVEFAVMNMYAGKFNLCIVKKPMQKDYLEDIAAITGSMAMTKDKGLIIPKIEYVGLAKKVVTNQHTTTIYIDDSKIESVNKYVESLKNQLELAEDFPTQTKLEERIARLTGKIFTINIGEKTDASLKQLRDKTDDAVNSLKKVWKNRKDGFVIGGGMALYNIGNKLLKNENINDGEKIVYESCCINLFQMLQNGGEDAEIINKISVNGGGYNALTMEYEPDMIKAGIVDAARVISTSFLNAADFASDFVTYENVITPIPQVESGLQK